MKKILITGGTGFLGRNLALFLKEKYEILLIGRNNKQNQYAKQITGCNVIPCDITNMESLRDIFNEYRPNIVIHAAATKFVDLSEKYPMECVDINVFGSQNVCRLSIDKNVEIVIGISTDKATPPIRNTYGLTKSLMERMFCSMNNKSDTKFTCVRYGNVAWSTGSVLPIWKDMFDKTKVIKTTGPQMRRFFFTVNDAVELVNTALLNINDIEGKILSRYMKSAKMSDILDVWIKNFGGNWEIIEGRPGERMDEFLIGELELQYSYEKIYNNTKHYIISFNELSKNPIKNVISSENTEKLTDEEILDIINFNYD